MVETRGDGASLFDGLTSEEIGEILGRLVRRAFPAGAEVIAQGDHPRQVYLVRNGLADVLVADARGVEHRINRVREGATLGELSLLTGEPATGTVRAATDLEVLVLTEADLEQVSTRFPRVYRNLSTILAERLARTTRRALGEMSSRLTVLLDRGAPPLLGYALACSVAWHARTPTLLAVLDDEPADLLATLAAREPDRPPAGANGRGPARGVARVLLAPPHGPYAPEALPATVEDLFRSYAHVLVQVRSETPPPLRTARVVTLAGPGRPPAGDGAIPPGHTIRGWVPDAAQPRPDRDGVVSVPPPAAADEAAIATGLLPARTPTGRALGWSARDLAGLKVGLALGAGSLKGYAHVGVLRALERADLRVDYLAGTSIGSAVAALHSIGHRPEEIARILDSFAPNAIRFALPSKGLLSGAGFRRTVRLLGKETRIEDLPIPVALVAADIDAQREVVFRRGLLWLAVLASSAVPGLFPAQRVGPYTLVDGGVLNPVPSDVAADMGADVVLAITLGTASGATDPDAEAVETEGPGPSLVRVLRRSIEIMESKISAESAGAATLVVAPRVDEQTGSRLVRLRKFADGRRFVEAGEAATEAALPRLAATLPWLAA